MLNKYDMNINKYVDDKTSPVMKVSGNSSKWSQDIEQNMQFWSY